MAEKRRQSSRIKTEPAAKRRISESLVEKPKVPEKAAKATPVGAGKDTKTAKDNPVATLPTKISDSKPLPVLAALQSLNLLDSEYQSMRER
jgi:hypothetical protein